MRTHIHESVGAMMIPRKVTSVESIENPYTKRILSNVIGKDPLLVLSQTPARLKRLTRGLSRAQLRKPPAEGKWSIIQIVTHLADVELVLAFRLRMALAQSGSPLQAVDQDKWAGGLRYEQADLKNKIDLFTTVRKDHLAMYRTLTPEQWERYGMHEERGKESVEHMVQLYAGHDINHLQQIEHIIQLLKKKK